MEYLENLKLSHVKAAKFLKDVILCQNQLKQLESDKTAYFDAYGVECVNISFNILTVKRKNNLLLHSYKKELKKINL